MADIYDPMAMGGEPDMSLQGVASPAQPVSQRPPEGVDPMDMMPEPEMLPTPGAEREQSGAISYEDDRASETHAAPPNKILNELGAANAFAVQQQRWTEIRLEYERTTTYKSLLNRLQQETAKYDGLQSALNRWQADFLTAPPKMEESKTNLTDLLTGGIAMAMGAPADVGANLALQGADERARKHNEANIADWKHKTAVGEYMTKATYDEMDHTQKSINDTLNVMSDDWNKHFSIATGADAKYAETVRKTQKDSAWLAFQQTKLRDMNGIALGRLEILDANLKQEAERYLTQATWQLFNAITTQDNQERQNLIAEARLAIEAIRGTSNQAGQAKNKEANASLAGAKTKRDGLVASIAETQAALKEARADVAKAQGSKAKADARDRVVALEKTLREDKKALNEANAAVDKYQNLVNSTQSTVDDSWTNTTIQGILESLRSHLSGFTPTALPNMSVGGGYAPANPLEGGNSIEPPVQGGSSLPEGKPLPPGNIGKGASSGQEPKPQGGKAPMSPSQKEALVKTALSYLYPDAKSGRKAKSRADVIRLYEQISGGGKLWYDEKTKKWMYD